jgi:hypothetical protein
MLIILIYNIIFRPNSFDTMKVPENGAEFAVMEDFYPFSTPFLFVLLRQGIIIASLSTGQVL